MSGLKPILIAEDYDDDAVFLQRSLKKAGVMNPVFLVRDGAAVIAWLEGIGIYSDRDKYPLPAILFLDLKMPVSDGFTVLDWLKQRREFDEMLVVVLTGHQDTRNLSRAYELGADSFLTKPCELEDAQNLIEHFTGHWMLQDPPSDPPRQSP